MDSEEAQDRRPIPRHFPDFRAARRRLLVGQSLMVVGVVWGLALAYALWVWLLDPLQRSWVFFCYAWEVPLVGGLATVGLPVWWLTEIERCHRARRPEDEPPDAEHIAAMLVWFPTRVAVTCFAASVIGYALGGVQLRTFANLPWAELEKLGTLGMVTDGRAADRYGPASTDDTTEHAEGCYLSRRRRPSRGCRSRRSRWPLERSPTLKSRVAYAS